MSEDKGSNTPTLPDLPVYFKPFTAESLKAIRRRMDEEKSKSKNKANKKKYHEDDTGPKPDPKLEQGVSLPIRLASAFDPKCMANIPLEDIDPFYATIPTFVLITKGKGIFRFSATNAIWCLSPFNPIRRVAISILTDGIFSLIIMSTITANCCQMILPASPVMESLEVVFTSIYTFESAVKVFARGFILEKFTYLRDPWNWLDFVVILLAYMTMGTNLGNLASLRTGRVFRALKTVAIVPGLKTIVGAVIESVKNLRDVIILTVFALSVFSLVGLQIYKGILTQKCIQDFPEDGSEGKKRDINWHTWNLNITNWHPYPPPNEYGASDYPLCGNSSGAGGCPENYTCFQGYGMNPDYGYTSFDSFGWAFLSAFRLMTQDYLEGLYQQILRSAGPWHMLFFIVITFLGSYYLVNLILASVAISYEELRKRAEEEKMAEAAEIEAIKAEANARVAKIAAHASAADAAAIYPKKPLSRMSSRSFRTWSGENGEQMKSGGNVYFVDSHSKFKGIPRKKLDVSFSLPGSPYRKQRESGRQKLMIFSVSSYMDAQEHFPYADDSMAANPMSEENGAVVLPFRNGLHTNALPTYALTSRYNSHASLLSYASHDVFGAGRSNAVGVTQTAAIKETQLIQRALKIYGDSDKKQKKLFNEVYSKSVDEMWTLKQTERESMHSSPQFQHNGVGGVEVTGQSPIHGICFSSADLMVLNEIIEKTPKRSRPSHASDGTVERISLSAKMKASLIKGSLVCLDLFCLWDCGFPWSLFKKAVSFVIFDAFTELFITLMIVINTIFMALDHYRLEENPTLNSVLLCGNVVFTTVFTLESALKIIAMSPKYFFQVGWNVFDFIIVVFSLIEVVFEDAGLPGIKSFRLLRVFKLAKSWPTLNMVIMTMGKTVGALSNLVFVLVIIIFIFVVMGMQLFAQNYFDKAHLFPGGVMPRSNFTDFAHSFLIVFGVLCEEWIEAMWDCMLVSGSICIPFFLMVFVIGNLVVLNLFLALLLSSFDGPNLASDSDGEPNKIAEAFDRIARFQLWLREGIRRHLLSLKDFALIAKNRVVPGAAPATEAGQQEEAVAAQEAAIANIKNKAVNRKRSRLGDTARLVMNSRKLMQSLQQMKVQEAEVEVIKDEDVDSMKCYGLDTHYPKSRKDEEGENTDQEEDGRGNVSQDEDGEWIEDDDVEETGKGEECVHGPKGEEEEYPTYCMPPRFYERFPIFAVDDTTFGVYWTAIRLKTFRLIENKYFETAVIIMILLSSIALAFEDVHLPNNPVLIDLLLHMDRILTVIFFFEMLIKFLALGFVAYFTSAWCWLDFVLVVVSLVNFVAALAGYGNVQAFKTMRTLRALRPLRAMSRMQGMRVVVNALIGAIPNLVNMLLVCFLFWLIFAILGVQLFSGKFYKCYDPEDGSRLDNLIIRNKVECLKNNYTWENSVMNFDHVGMAYLCLFQVATFKGWYIMNDAMDSREIDEQPQTEVNFVMCIYFVIFIIFGSFFTLNLFVGGFIDNLKEQRKQAVGPMEMLMTEDQQKYYAAMQKMGSKMPIKAILKPTWKPQAMVFELVTNRKFDMAIMIFIGVDMMTMALDHYQMSQAREYTLGVINSIFVAIFTAECFLKIFAHPHLYFTEPWNLFDFAVVLMSLAGMVLSDLIKKYFISPTLLRVVRVGKIGRVLRLVKGAKGIRTLLFVLKMSVPALLNVCLLLFLVMFIFSILGMSFFMNVKLRGGLDELYNFQTFGQSINLLFMMSTSAGWDGVLDGLMNEDDCELPDPEIGRSGDCGSTIVGIAFILSYLVISYLIIVNMYIAVILENYTQATEEVKEGLTDDDYDMYYEIWEQFDPDGTQFVKYGQLSDFLDILEPPLQIRKPNKFKIISMDIPICKGDMMYCVDILVALTKYFFVHKGKPIDEGVEINQVIFQPNRPGYEPVSSTLWRQREEYCARLIQNVWRRHKSARQSGSGLEETGNKKKSSMPDKDGDHNTLIQTSYSKTPSIN